MVFEYGAISVYSSRVKAMSYKNFSLFMLVISSRWRYFQQEIKFRAYEYFTGLTRNPEWFLMRRLARAQAVRNVSHWLRQSHYRAQLTIAPTQLESPYFAGLQVEAIVSSLEANGIYQGLRLPVEAVQAIRTFAFATPCYANGKPQAGFLYSQKEQAHEQCLQPILIGRYFNADEHCDAIAQLIDDPILKAIAADYLQAQPAYLGSQLWWSFPNEASEKQRCQVSQAFHYDLDGYRFIKFFFYLTDVDEQSGPHVFVPGTHNCMKLQHRLLRKRYTDKAILDAYGADSILTLYGTAGFGFVEDTFCFHKGRVPISRDRLILQIEFGIKDYGMQHQRFPAEKLQMLPGQAEPYQASAAMNSTV